MERLGTRLVTAILFACCYVTSWGKFGRVFCKQTSVAACRFQNECNKVEIALRVVQFWSEIKLVITNRFCNHAFDFRPNCTPLSAITIINCPSSSIVIETGMSKRRVMKRRVISESYDFGVLCVNYAQTTPTLTNDHTQFLNSLDVFLN